MRWTTNGRTMSEMSSSEQDPLSQLAHESQTDASFEKSQRRRVALSTLAVISAGIFLASLFDALFGGDQPGRFVTAFISLNVMVVSLILLRFLKPKAPEADEL